MENDNMTGVIVGDDKNLLIKDGQIISIPK